MKKPNSYNETQASGNFTPIELGGHYLEIKQVEEMQSRTGRDMIKVSFDFARNDSQPAYFANAFKDDVRPDKKWPNAGTTYILTEDNDGNCSRQFKTFCTCVENSNNGFEVVWGDGFAQCFKNKAVGAVFGEVEEEYNGSVHINHKLRWFISKDKVDGATVPEAKYLNNRQPQTATANDGFMNIPDGLDEELPFA